MKKIKLVGILTSVLILGFLGLIFQNFSTQVATSCHVSGQLNYASATLQFCDGANYQSMKYIQVPGGCSVPGQISVVPSDMAYCDGSRLWSIKGPASGASCPTNGSISWSGGAPALCLSNILYSASTPTTMLNQVFEAQFNRLPTSAELSSLYGIINLSTIGYLELSTGIQQAVAVNPTIADASATAWNGSDSGGVLSLTANATACESGYTVSGNGCARSSQFPLSQGGGCVDPTTSGQNLVVTQAFCSDPYGVEEASILSLYVAPSGNDANLGLSASSPLETLDGARRAVATNRKNGISGTIYVNFAGGLYPLTSSVFGSADSGSASGNNVYRASPGAVPIFSGAGSPVTGWNLYSTVSGSNNQIWRAPVPSGSHFRHLYVNGAPAIRSRLPAVSSAKVPFYSGTSSSGDTLNFHLAGIVPTNNPTTIGSSWIPFFKTSTPKVLINSGSENAIAAIFPGGIPGNSSIEFSVEPDAAQIVFPVNGPQSLADLSANGMAVNPNSLVNQGVQADYNNNPASLAYIFQNGQSFHLENALQFLNDPHAVGEWFLDTSVNPPMLYYETPPNSSMNSYTVYAPTLQTLVQVQGTATSHVQGLRFVGLHFENTDWLYQNQTYQGTSVGLWTGQAASIFNQCGIVSGPCRQVATDAVAIQSATGIVFHGCTFQNLGGNGLGLQTDTNANVIENSVFHDIGVNGINVDETHWAEASTNPVSITNIPFFGPNTRDQIKNNTIYVVGRDLYSSIGIFIASGQDEVVQGNEVSYGPYSGISTGWHWDTTRLQYQGGNQITGNHVHHVMCRLSDGAGIYNLGNEQALGDGTQQLMSGNYVHDIILPWDAANKIAAALYFDQGSSSLTATGNACRLYAGPYSLTCQTNGNLVTDQFNVCGDVPNVSVNYNPNQSTHDDDCTLLNAGTPFAAVASEASVISAAGPQCPK